MYHDGSKLMEHLPQQISGELQSFCCGNNIQIILALNQDDDDSDGDH